MPDVDQKCCQLLVENIHITITFESPTEKVVASILATEYSICEWRVIWTSRLAGMRTDVVYLTDTICLEYSIQRRETYHVHEGTARWSCEWTRSQPVGIVAFLCIGLSAYVGYDLRPLNKSFRGRVSLVLH